MSTDRIEKKVLLRAPLQRVWRALADSEEFGRWFGMRLNGPFAAGTKIKGVIVPTTVNKQVAEAQKRYEGTPFEIAIERIEPERLLSFRWHPNAVDSGIDYSLEPTTLVTFMLEEVREGVMLTVTESGFDQIPISRRATAFSRNEQGWSAVMGLIKDYLA